MSDSKNESAWLKLFDKYNILDAIGREKIFQISANQINEFREARLMTKFDHQSQLPHIFSDNNLSILPITRGSYTISDFKTYFDFNKEDCEIVKIDFPGYLESIDYKT